MSLVVLIKNNEITYRSEIKFLGLFIMESLTWQAQFYSLCANLSKTYYLIKLLKNVMSTQMIWSTYFANFQSGLRYGIIFWGGDKKYTKIFRLHKKVIRLITGTHKRESCMPIFRRFLILTLASLYIFEILCFFKKNVKGT